MNYAHLHLLLNHIPIVGIPLALAFLIFGRVTKNSSTQKFSLWVLAILALITLPVYLSGEPGEKVIRNLPGFSEDFISPHEEAGETSLILSLITGGFALINLWFWKNDKLKARLIALVVILGVVSSLSLFYTGYLGGQVRHTEFRSDFIKTQE